MAEVVVRKLMDLAIEYAGTWLANVLLKIVASIQARSAPAAA